MKKKNEKEETQIGKPLKCSYCHVRFKRTKQLINHKCFDELLSQHPKPQHGTIEEKPKKKKRPKMKKTSKCSICYAKFLSSQSLENHLNLQHSIYINRKFSCLICKKEFSSQELLSQHSQRFHQSDVLTKIFSCFICKKQFRSKELLSQHSQRSHQGRFLQNPGQNCPICDSVFSNFTVLNQHVASKHQPSELRKKLLK